MSEQLTIPFHDPNRKRWEGMTYVRRGGKWVAEEGLITICGVRHAVVNGYVLCDPSKNQRAWNRHYAADICEKCLELRPKMF